MLITEANICYSICAVHGLNGNAFDTWMGESKMWLRDMLPEDDRFKRCRIMTFGYNSALFDKRGVNDRLQDYADDLLEVLGRNRESADERDRPLILLCHSMGGLVARKAVVRLYHFPNKFKHLNIEHIGMMFLSTPHSGSQAADWRPFIIALGEVVGLRGKPIVNQLSSFNPASVDDSESFSIMEKAPKFHCFCESAKTDGSERNVCNCTTFPRLK